MKVDLLPVFDKFHKVTQNNRFLVGKKDYYMTVLDLSQLDQSEDIYELKAFK